jgi:hypothetical protein
MRPDLRCRGIAALNCQSLMLRPRCLAPPGFGIDGVMVPAASLDPMFQVLAAR